MGLGQTSSNQFWEFVWLTRHVGRDCSYDQDDVENYTDHNTNDVPQPSTRRKPASTVMITTQPRRVDLEGEEGRYRILEILW